VTDRPGGGHGRGVPLQLAQAPDPAPAEAAFAAAYREHHAFVWRILRHLGVPDLLIDDVLQDVFLVAYRRWDRWDPDSSLRSWLYGIARRVTADVRRGVRRREARLAAVVAPEDPPGPDELIAGAQAADFVGRFLAGLDDDQREVFVLAEVEHLTAPEIAAATGAKLNTVYSRLRLARAAFDRAVERRIRGETRDHGPRR
jgi:RNA polymerase sigma-70 factor (ECF subfamily)